MNKYIFIYTIILLILSCNQVSNYEKIESLLFTEFEFENLHEMDYIVIINELGDCLNCNNAFSVAMSKYIESENILFIICGTGSRVDISPYINSTSNQVIWDKRNSFIKLNLVGRSAIIKLKKQRLDTIIEIELDTKYNNILPSI